MSDPRTTGRTPTRPRRRTAAKDRLAYAALAALLLWGTLSRPIELPAIAVIGLLLWAVISTTLLLGLLLRQRRKAGR